MGDPADGAANRAYADFVSIQAEFLAQEQDRKDKARAHAGKLDGDVNRARQSLKLWVRAEGLMEG